MIIEDSIKVSNYKCFTTEPQGFDRIYPINIIIGKNNSGKSSLIDLIEYIIAPNWNFANIRRVSSYPKVILTHLILQDEIENVRRELLKKPALKPDFDNFIKDKEDIYISFEFDDQNRRLIKDRNISEGLKSVLAPKINSTFHNKTFRRINAERNIVPEKAEDVQDILSFNGVNATNIIRRIINIVGYDQNIIKKLFIRTLNSIVSPDITFSDIIVREDNSIWEIYFEDNYGNWVALSKMGSGVKTIILVLLNLLAIPTLEKKKIWILRIWI